jgi:hypothetical protein
MIFSLQPWQKRSIVILNFVIEQASKVATGRQSLVSSRECLQALVTTY